jgi:hypothetical protein
MVEIIERKDIKMKLDNNGKTVTKSSWEIRDVYTSTRHPGIVYANLYFDGELEMSATLKMCYERILDNPGRKSVKEI